MFWCIYHDAFIIIKINSCPPTHTHKAFSLTPSSCMTPSWQLTGLTLWARDLPKVSSARILTAPLTPQASHIGSLVPFVHIIHRLYIIHHHPPQCSPISLHFLHSVIMYVTENSLVWPTRCVVCWEDEILCICTIMCQLCNCAAY